MSSSFPPSAIRRLGQNFLIDPNIVRKIVALAALRPDDDVLEIGPGRGALTHALCLAARHVTAIEVDPRLHAYLSERQSEYPRVSFVLHDAMHFPLESLKVGTIVVANLPYYLSNPLLFRLLDQGNRFPYLVLMLQDEVADRLVARPGSPEYGVLTVMAQYRAEITKAFTVSAQCFRPRPEVASAVVLLRTKVRSEAVPVEEPHFGALVRAAFRHRRKTLVNSLRDEGYAQPAVVKALHSLGLLSNARAEVLSVGQFVALTRELTS